MIIPDVTVNPMRVTRVQSCHLTRHPSRSGKPGWQGPLPPLLLLDSLTDLARPGQSQFPLACKAPCVLDVTDTTFPEHSMHIYALMDL